MRPVGGWEGYRNISTIIQNGLKISVHNIEIVPQQKEKATVTVANLVN